MRKRVILWLSVRPWKLACEATLQPLERCSLDAAIIFGHILTIPDAIGVDLQIEASVGPVILNPIRMIEHLERLRDSDVEEALYYVFETINLVIKAKALAREVSFIGFAGSPWTLVCYMIEGQSSKEFVSVKAMVYQNPNFLHRFRLLQKLTSLTINYLNTQIRAGVDALMIFGTWGGLLTSTAYEQFSLNYLSQIAVEVMREKEEWRILLIFLTQNRRQ